MVEIINLEISNCCIAVIALINNDDLSATEAIVGISVGVALVLVVIVVLVICWCKRRSAAAANAGTATDGGNNRRGSALFKIQGRNPTL